MNANLTYALTRLQGVSTNTFAVEPSNGGGSASATSLIIFHLPSNSLVHTRALCLHADVTTAGTAAGARLPSKVLDSLISRITISAGGVQISSSHNGYNTLRHMKDALTKQRADTVCGHPDIVRDITPVTGAAIVTTGNEVYTAGQRMFATTFLEGFLGTCEPSILDTSLFPSPLTIEIQFESNAVLSSVAGVTLPGHQTVAGTPLVTNFDRNGNGAATYSVSNLRLSCSVVSIAGSMYDDMVASRMQSTGFLELPFKNYFTFESEHTGSTRVGVSAQSLDRVWVALRDTDFETQGAPKVVPGGLRSINNGLTATDGTEMAAANALPKTVAIPLYNAQGSLDTAREMYTPKFFTFKEDAAGATPATYQFQVNGVNMPQSSVTAPEMYYLSKKAVLGYEIEDRYSLQQYRENYFVQCVRLNLPDSEFERTLSGLDTRNSTADIYYKTTGLNNRRIFIAAEVTSTLRIGPNRSIEVVS